MTSDSAQPSTTLDELEAQTFGFDHWPLEHFRGMSAEAIEAHEGIGPKFRQRIQALLAEADELRRAAGMPLPEPPPTTPAPAPDEYLEPAAPGRSGPLIILMVLVLVSLLAAVLWFASHSSGAVERQQLAEARAAFERTRQQLGGLSDELVASAVQQADRVAQKAKERNYGAALEHLDGLEQALRSMGGADGAAPPLRDRGAARQQALAEVDAARGALLLTDPHSQQQVEEACLKLRTAVQALRGEVKE